MALYEKKILARKLRKEGESILFISRKIKASKSSVSSWCSDIVLTDEQIESLSKRKNLLGLRGRMMGAKANKDKKIKAIKDADKQAKYFISKITDRETILIASGLYWAEGAKSASGFQFVNSDPDMVLFIMLALRSFGINKEDIFCTIQINQMHKPRIEEVLIFWKNLLEFSDEQFRKTTFIKTIQKKKYENYNSYFGICRVQVKRSTSLKYKMLGLIKAIKNVTVTSM